ncbi:sulfite exporter TauE/SafE family protein [Corynebacterium sp. YSMAA1_1_D6]|uniref:sulfite exporter TauE/SafE family protein n=1 Tax=Corynebacterium sp. YSMAA1_1_D6 TaxID=3383589 RepID=UPI0038D16358
MLSGLYIFIGVLILVGTICQGTIGFGLGTIATPILALIKPELVPTLVLLLAFVISTTTMFKARAAVSWDIVAISSLARIPGSMLGAWAIAALSHRGLSLFIGCAVIVAMTLSSLGWSPKRTTSSIAVAGVASGFLGTSTSIGGPPMALVLKGYDPDRVRGTLSGTFIVGTLISLVILALHGQVTQLHLTAAAAYLPVVIVGLIAAGFLNRYINATLLNRIVVVVAISAALALIAEALLA